MRVLLDENLPAKLRFDFGAGFEVKTVAELGWNGKKNGELLKLMTSNRFQVFVTLDKNIKYQQNLRTFPIIVCLLNANDNKHETVQPLVAKAIDAIRERPATGLIQIN